MKISSPNFSTKCDTVMCNNNAKYKLITNSFKGDSYLCEKCLKELYTTLKRLGLKNETEK